MPLPVVTTQLGPMEATPVVQVDAAGNIVTPGGAGAGGGDASAANQTTGNTSLAAINAGIGAPNDAAATSDTGTFSLLALVKRLFSKFPASLGAKTSANSLSVVLATDQAGAALPAGTSRSGTIAAAGTAQTLAPANTARQSLTGQAPSNAAIGINEIGGTAAIGSADTYVVAAGQAFSIATNRAVSVVCATAGAVWSATETP